MKFVNLTSHVINELGSNQKFPVSGAVARVATHETSEVIGEVVVKTVHYGDIVGLPKPQSDIVYIVSAIVLNAIQNNDEGRTDVVSPSTLIRGANNQPVGCDGFRRNG